MVFFCQHNHQQSLGKHYTPDSSWLYFMGSSKESSVHCITESTLCCICPKRRSSPGLVDGVNLSCAQKKTKKYFIECYSLRDVTYAETIIGTNGILPMTIITM